MSLRLSVSFTSYFPLMNPILNHPLCRIAATLLPHIKQRKWRHRTMRTIEVTDETSRLPELVEEIGGVQEIALTLDLPEH